MITNIKQIASFAHRDNSNIFSNVLVKDGYMTAQNSMTGMSIKVDSAIDFCCNAERLKQVLNNCQSDKLKMKITDKNLMISSGNFKSRIPLIPTDHYPLIDNSGDVTKVQSDILTHLNSITQFTDQNDVRMALQGVQLTDGFIKATNGHIGIKKTIDPVSINDTVIPAKSILIMSKTNYSIQTVIAKNNMLFFNFEDGYLFTKTIDQRMPDIDRLLSVVKNPIPTENLKESVKSIAQLCGNDRIILIGKELKTKSGDAVIGGFDYPESAFNVDYLSTIIDVAETIDLSQYPAGCPFDGEGIQGIIMGVRV